MAFVGKDSFVSLPKRNLAAPRFGERGGIVHSKLIQQSAGVGARNTLSQVHALVRAEEVIHAIEIRGVDYQRVAFPTPPRIAHVAADRGGGMRTAIQRN